MFRKLTIVVAGLVLLATGLLHGRLTNRWSYSESLQSSVEKFDQLPLVFGDWDGTITNKDVKPETMKFSGAFVQATFIQRQTGDAVHITLVCGRAGPLSLHPPSICFPAHGFALKGREAKTVVESNGSKAEFLAADFAREQPTGEEQIHILWCYGFDGQWAVPENPRVSLASRPVVFKLYASRVGLADRYAAGEDPTESFLRVFLPELKKVLFAS